MSSFSHLPLTTRDANLRVSLDYLESHGTSQVFIAEWAAIHRQLIDFHGTRGLYLRSGCRCDLCSEAEHLYNITRRTGPRATLTRDEFVRSILEDAL
jgi:hypothetical protein